MGTGIVLYVLIFKVLRLPEMGGSPCWLVQRMVPSCVVQEIGVALPQKPRLAELRSGFGRAAPSPVKKHSVRGTEVFDFCLSEPHIQW